MAAQLLDPRIMNASLRHLLLPFLAILLLAGCSTIATYDKIAYDKATGAKAEALMLMDNATGSYAAHAKEVEAVKLTIAKAFEYDRGRSRNAETVAMWELLRAPDGNLFGGFLRRWREKGSFKPDAIAIKKPDIEQAFDEIIALEIGKPKPKKD